jgi:YidC/Oxa1 family membrane protein insertase
MPLISVFMGFTLPAGLGLYWAISAVVRAAQQLAINKYLSKKSLDDLIAENQKKAAKKREKKGTSAKAINKMATTSTRNVEDKKSVKMSDPEREKQLNKARQQTMNAKQGSLASKANMVSRYNGGQKVSDKNEKNQ